MSALAATDEHYFLWLSDIHYDPYFSTSQAFKSHYYPDVNCDSPDAPAYGQYGCDAPLALVHSAVEYAKRLTTHKSPTFVVLSGDSIRHGVDQLFTGGEFNEGAEGHSNNTNTSDSAVNEAAHSPWHQQAMEKAGEILHELVSLVQTSFPESEIILSLGNNDVVPDYYLELINDDDDDDDNESNNFTTTTKFMPETSGMLGVIYNSLASISTGTNNITTTLLVADDQSTFLRGGYYSRTVHDGALTILSLNTVLYSSIFQPTPRLVDDPGRQFTWMRKMLSKCHDSGTQAIIVGHISPAVGSFRHSQLWKDQYIQTYYDIIKEYDDLIIAQLFGHIHTDEFRVGSSSDIPSLSTPLLLGPSITPLHGNDPSIRLVKYSDTSRNTEKKTFTLLDYDSHRFSLEDPEEDEFSKLYTFSEAYGITLPDQINGLSSEVYRNILQKMEDVDGRESPILQSYRTFMQSGANNRFVTEECNSQCRNMLICSIQSATSSGYDRCLLQRSNVSWNSRGIIGVATFGIFFVVFVSVVILRCWKRRNQRMDFDSVHSVVENEQDEDDDVQAHDQEMI